MLKIYFGPLRCLVLLGVEERKKNLPIRFAHSIKTQNNLLNDFN